MKLILVMYNGSRPEVVPKLLDDHGVQGYTELRGAHGAGRTGKHAGTRAWPGETALFFSMVGDAEVKGLLDALRAQGTQSLPGESVHVAELPVEYFG